MEINIFKDHNLYPYTGSILEHFRSHFDTVYVSFIPFTDKDVLDEKWTDAKIIDEVKSVRWETVMKKGGFSSYREINMALKSRASAYEKALERPDLEEKLFDLSEEQGIHEPIEGCYDIFSKISIYRALKLIGKNAVYLMDEFYEGNSLIDLEHVSEIEFAELVLPETYYIFSEDKEILFTLDWESCFFLIASSKDHLNRIINAELFEGFLCEKETTHQWEFTVEELVQNGKRSSVSRLMNKITTVLLVISFSVVTLTLIYWFYYRFGVDYIHGDHLTFRQFIFCHSIREIILLTQAFFAVVGLIASLYDKKYRNTLLLAGLLILEFILIGQLHINKGP